MSAGHPTDAPAQVWRPLKTVRRDPLAVAAADSVAEEDLVPAKTIYPDHVSETWTVTASPAHRWHFRHAQRPDEVLLIKCFDSLHSVARRAPHSAFVDPAGVGREARESVEVRAFLFHD